MDEKELNLENPIFTVYIHVGGMSKQAGEETIRRFRDNYCTYTNATFFIIPVSGDSKMELLWKGSKYSNLLDDAEEMSYRKSLQQVHKRLNEILILISGGISDDELRQKIRSLQLNDILENEI